ncbi:MAG: hypothetical protein Q4A79_01770 [Candidatus Saccharibacteria bacterium]|nr:hypothetical protein [Candidatus Saccharibacteria bacterium]
MKNKEGTGIKAGNEAEARKDVGRLEEVKRLLRSIGGKVLGVFLGPMKKFGLNSASDEIGDKNGVGRAPGDKEIGRATKDLRGQRDGRQGVIERVVKKNDQSGEQRLFTDLLVEAYSSKECMEYLIKGLEDEFRDALNDEDNWREYISENGKAADLRLLAKIIDDSDYFKAKQIDETTSSSDDYRTKQTDGYEIIRNVINKYADNPSWLDSREGCKFSEMFGKSVASAVAESEFYDNDVIFEDWFLRKRWIEKNKSKNKEKWWESTFGGGRDSEVVDDEDSGIVDVLHRLDVDFCDDPKVKEIFYDGEYLKAVYGEGILGKAHISKAIDEKTPVAFGGRLLESVAKSGISVDELIRDPFLRERRARLDERGEGQEAREIEWLYNLDRDYKFLDAYKKHPEIYNPDENEVSEIVKELIGEIPGETIAGIVEEYRRVIDGGNSVERANEKMVEMLSPCLGISSDDIPKIVHKKNFGMWAEYSRLEKEIRICVDARYFNEEKVLELMKVVAHEMCHARQDVGCNISAGLKELYKINYEHYFSYEWNVSRYARQLIEAEAFAFGMAFKRKVEEFLRKKE